jgi:putative component of membrane protein insertase Oxa1/YidC/SpoIIIJ protein YidD
MESGGFFSHCRGGSCSYYMCTSVSKKSVSSTTWYSRGRLTKDRKGHKENQDELGTEVSKEDKVNLGTYWKVVMKKLEVYVA